jgi:hypothetical protein
MKKTLKILLVLIPVVIIFTIFASDYFKESEKEVFYKIGLSGIKKQYNVGDELKFSLFLNGYGSDCGSYEIQVKRGNNQIDGKSVDIDCTETISEDFEVINLDVITLELVLSEPGSYIATGEFSNSKGEKFQYEKTFSVS